VFVGIGENERAHEDERQMASFLGTGLWLALAVIIAVDAT